MSQTPSESVPIERLTRTPYIRVLTYPTLSLRSAKSRIAQLARLGVRSLIFDGSARIGALGILGLGTVSVVTMGEVDGEVYALKIRRTDANRESMEPEFKLTKLVNRIGIGAKAVKCSKDFLVLERLHYLELYDWFKGLRGQNTRSSARRMVHRALNQCRQLDILGLDHGELSDLRKHIVAVGDEPVMVDFESASFNRGPKNVTTAAQHMLVGGKMSPLVRRLLGLRGTDQIVAALRFYKGEKDDYSYAKLLETLRISST